MTIPVDQPKVSELDAPLTAIDRLRLYVHDPITFDLPEVDDILAEIDAFYALATTTVGVKAWTKAAERVLARVETGEVDLRAVAEAMGEKWDQDFPHALLEAALIGIPGAEAEATTWQVYDDTGWAGATGPKDMLLNKIALASPSGYKVRPLYAAPPAPTAGREQALESGTEDRT